MKYIICVGLLVTFLFCADYGRIVGVVRDAETGEPLAGADVVVQGTELGAAADENGEYTVIYVPAGTYRVAAYYMSYDSLTYTSVVVNADQTTPLDFRLRPTVIEVPGVVTTAVRPMVVMTRTSTDRAITSSEIDRLPVTTINQVITLQAGVVQSDLGTHIRGGRSDEITYFLDGIVTKVPQSGFQSARINPSAVEEVTVVSGGFDAEYGDALSGVINVITREGGTKPSGSFSYLTDEAFSSNKINFGYNLYSLALGGPLPMTSRLRYFLSGELMLTDSYEPAFYKVPSPREDYKIQSRISYNLPNAKGKVILSGFHSREQWVYWNPLLGVAPNVKYLDNKPMTVIKNWIGTSTLNYMIASQTLVSLKLGATHYRRFYGNRDYDYETEHDRQWYQDYRGMAEHFIPMLLDEDALAAQGITVQDIMIDSLLQYHTQYENRGVSALRYSPYAAEGLFYTYGDYRAWRYWHNYDYQARLDVTHSIGKTHELKTGIDFTQYDLRFYDNNLPWVTNPFWDYYHRTPYKFSSYVQDKMDFEGIIARLGLRFDYFSPTSLTYTNPANLQDTSTTSAEVSYKISPRLGFSLPITSRMKLRFNYGHYFQFPALNDMYGSTDTSVVRIIITRGNAIVGNIGLDAQKTVSYEFGLENQFTDDLAFAFTSYFKDVYDLSQIREVPSLPTAYYQYFNVDYGNIKGFEFSLEKRMSNMWACGVSYTLQFARGTGSYAGEWYNDHYNYGIEPPVIDYWLDFDERHIMNAHFDVECPENFYVIPLRNFVSSAVFSYHAGRPYSPEDFRGNRLGDVNSARMPGYWNVDLSCSRSIPIGPVAMRFNVMITNLFNTEQVINVYSQSGEPDTRNDPEPILSQFSAISIASAYYSPQGDYNHDGYSSQSERWQEYVTARADLYNDPSNYNGPFRIQIGAGISF